MVFFPAWNWRFQLPRATPQYVQLSEASASKLRPTCLVQCSAFVSNPQTIRTQSTRTAVYINKYSASLWETWETRANCHKGNIIIVQMMAQFTVWNKSLVASAMTRHHLKELGGKSAFIIFDVHFSGIAISEACLGWYPSKELYCGDTSINSGAEDVAHALDSVVDWVQATATAVSCHKPFSTFPLQVMVGIFQCTGQVCFRLSMSCRLYYVMCKYV